MQLNIQNVTPETVEVQGQSVTRTFAEGVMLSGLPTKPVMLARFKIDSTTCSATLRLI